MNVPKTFTGRFAEFHCKNCGRSFGVTPTDSQVRTLSRGAESMRGKVAEQMAKAGQEILGLPVQLTQMKEVKWAVQCRVEAVTPTGVAIPLGIVRFSDAGKVYSEQSGSTLSEIMDRVDPKSRC
jgi:hypothetical protein